MVAALSDYYGGPAGNIFFHFDTDSHFLKLETFVSTAESARNIVKSLDHALFGDSLRYDIIVLPPEDGSFLAKLAVVVMAAGGVAFELVDSEIGSAFIEGLTHRSSVEWSKHFGQAAKEAFSDLEADLDPELSGKALRFSTRHEPKEDETAHDEVECKLGASLLAELTKGILEKTTAELKQLGLHIGPIADALDARADFYKACVDDRNVKRVGFTESQDFPVPRSSFPERAQKLNDREKDEDEPEWFVSIEKISVSSPNWDEEDQKNRQWKGRDDSGRDCYFIVLDNEFWSLAKKKSLQLEVLDLLVVQWAFQVIDGRIRNRRVLRVLQFNKEALANPLTDEQITSLIGSRFGIFVDRGQSDLFS